MIDIYNLISLKIPSQKEETERLLNMIPGEFYKDEGSIFYDVFSVVASERIELLTLLKQVLYNSFGLYATDIFLDYKVQEVGIERKLGAKARGLVKFVGAVGTKIPHNTVVLCDDLQYFVIRDTIIGENGEVETEIIAEKVGYEYNVKAHTINKIGTTIQGVESVDNLSDIIYGLSDETDDELRERYLIKVREPATSGNGYHYKKWALEVEGVGNCKVYPLFNGPGTVKLLLIGNNGSILQDSKIKEVKAHIETVRPIGVDVTVVNADVLNLVIKANIVRNGNTPIESIKKDFMSKVNVYLSNTNLRGEAVSYGKIASLLYNVPGVLDFNNLTLNDIANSATIKETEIAFLSEVILNE